MSVRVPLDPKKFGDVLGAMLGLNKVIESAGIDQKSLLKPSEGAYVGNLNLPASGHWLVLVEDEAKTWRVMGSVMLPAAGEVVIGATENGSKG